MTSKGTVKLGDFGVSKCLGTGKFAKTSLGTPYYLPPEVCAGQNYDFKADIWMLGCLLYELCSSKKPFEGDTLPSVISSILEKPYEQLKGYSETIEAMISRMLEKDPTKRASIEELLRMPVLEKLAGEIQQGDEYAVQVGVRPRLSDLMLDENEEVKAVPQHPPSLQMKRPLEVRRNGLTINTCFDNGTSREKANAKAASTKSHLRSKPLNSNKVKAKHFIFEDYLLDPQGYSPNRPLLFTEFLRDKLGEETFNSACEVLKNSVDPLAVIDEDPERLLGVIGAENAQCLKVFKYIMRSNVSTPVHSKLTTQQLELLQHHSRAQSMHTPNGFETKKPSLATYQQNRPYSTKAQAIAGLKPASNAPATEKKVLISPLNSEATDISVETPKDI
eukprot:TRINITY_DN355_c0_g5_i1.p1 TRINITY_DN355_c0_g5~~TRINITY_DN355_c0_g5_i1.p1  ORF type:complete len:390 (-),score=100.52 TRINITY_DN355_c0_g5_i1:33-1202(-)